MTQKGKRKAASSRLIDYAHVSTDDQNLRSQVRALKAHGVEARLTFKDKVSGARAERPGLDACLAALQQEDVLIVWQLGRQGHSLKHLIESGGSRSRSALCTAPFYNGFAAYPAPTCHGSYGRLPAS